MISEVVNGKVIDISYRKLREGHYAVMLGEKSIGQIIKSRDGWNVIPAFPTDIGVISGLKSKWKATDLLRQIWRIKCNNQQREPKNG